MKKILAILSLTVTIIFGCTTSNTKSNSITLIEKPERMFWEIKGPKNSIYIQGTIHVGNDKMFPIDQSVLETFKNSKILYAEISSKEFATLKSKILGLVLSSIVTNPNKKVDAQLTQNEKNILIETLGEKQYKSLNKFEPWVMNITISESISKNLKLNAKKGIDMFFYDLAKNQEKEILGLDELKTQLEIIKFGSIEDQMYMLKQSISAIEDKSCYEELKELIDCYIANNRQKLNDIIAESMEYDSDNPEIVDLEKKYYNALIVNRNTQWAKTFEKLLKKNKDVFIFAGAAHFLGDDSVFEIMKKNGILKNQLESK